MIHTIDVNTQTNNVVVHTKTYPEAKAVLAFLGDQNAPDGTPLHPEWPDRLSDAQLEAYLLDQGLPPTEKRPAPTAPSRFHR